MSIKRAFASTIVLTYTLYSSILVNTYPTFYQFLSFFINFYQDFEQVINTMAYTSKFQFDQTNTPIMTEPQQQDYEEDIFELNIEEPVTTSASSNTSLESASYYYYDNNNNNTNYSLVNELQLDLTSPLLTPQHYSRNSSISSVDSALSSTSPSVSSSSYSSSPHFEFSSPTFYYNNNSNNNSNNNNSSYDSSYLLENSIVEKNNELIKNNYKAYLLKLTIPSY